MKLYWFDSTAGIAVLNDDGQPVDQLTFDQPVTEFPKIQMTLQEGRLPEPYSILLGRLSSTEPLEISFEEDRLVTLVRGDFPINCVVEKPSPKRQAYFARFPEIFTKVDSASLVSATYSICHQVTRRKIQEASREADKVLIQAIAALDDVNKSLNVFYERIREWFGLHFPELTDSLISNNSLFTALVYNLQDRMNFTREVLEDRFKFRPQLVETILDRREKSMGAELAEPDSIAIRSFAKEIIALENFKTIMETYIESTIEGFAPNLYTLVGSLIGARLIALAGGLKKLSEMPASRIQLLGAERALFRSLKTDATSPKHGVIFQWPQIRGAKSWLRGKISRALAGKLAIAARVDFFKGEFVGGKLKEELLERIADIEKRYPEPPPQKKKPPKQRKGGRGGKPRSSRRPTSQRGGSSRPYGKRQQKFSKKGGY